MKALDEMLELSDAPGVDVDTTPVRPPRTRLAIAWLREEGRRHLWPITVLFVALAAAATITSSTGELIRDNRFEQFWNPARRIAKSLTVWDGSRGLGRVREDFWPGTTAPLAVLRGLGLSPAMSQRLWHTLVLVILGTGVVAVLRLFRPRIGIEHLFAGLVVMFGAFSAAFLVPSNLAFQLALAPWFIVALWRGVTETRPWRWAALFALLVFVAGNTDLPGLIYSMVPLVPVSIYLVFVDRSARVRDLVGWLARAGLLCVVVSAAAFAKTLAASATLEQRLAETEAPEVSSITSSWSESFRGLGNWLSYFHEAGQATKPQGEIYFVSPVVILATFVPAIAAAAVLWRSHWRGRILMAWMAICSLVIMVEAFPLDHPSPIGRFLLDVLTNVSSFEAFRNTYKAGAGLVIGIGILFGVGVAMAARWAGRHGPIPRRVLLVAAVLVVLAGAVPFWTGGLYDGDRAMTAVPTYWTQAFTYLDNQPADTRVLVLPASSRTHYRWGWIGDDIFDAMLVRDHAVATGVPLSTPLAANVLEALSATASDPSYQPGTLAPALRRLGISEIVLRNDLDWRDMARPRPAAYQGLRNDPDFHQVATFGAPGENTTAAQDTSVDGDVERGLPPVEIYALDAPTPELRARDAQPSMVVSGDGYAWPGLAGAGLLAGDAPMQYSGSLDRDALATAFGNGSALVVTDTNRRRLRVVLGHEPDYSYLLSDGQDLDRPTQALFPYPAAQSTAWYPDARSISLTGNPRPVNGSEPWNRPANVFDDDPETSWTMRPVDNPLGRSFEIQLRQPKTVDHIRVVLAPNTTVASGLTQLLLSFSDGPDQLIALTSNPVDNRETELDFPARETSYIGIKLLGTSLSGGPVGFSDISFPGVDLREFVQTPTDVVDRAEGDEALTAALLTTPTSYVFTRDATSPPSDHALPLTAADRAQASELALRRRFVVTGTRPYTLSGVLHAGTRMTDEQLNAIIGAAGATYSATSTGRAGGDIAGWGGYASDGDLETAWHDPVTALPLPSVTVVVPRRELTSVDVTFSTDDTTARPTAFYVTIGDDKFPILQQVDDQACPDPSGPCTATVRVPLTTRPTAGAVKVAVATYDNFDSTQRNAVNIDEVRVNGVANAVLDTNQTLPATCQDLGLTVDGKAVPVQLTGTIQDLLDAKPVAWQACSGIDLGPGAHELVTADRPLFDRAEVATSDVVAHAAPAAPPAQVEVVSSTPTALHLRVTSPGPTTLWLGESYDDRWSASTDGGSAVAAVAFDTQSGWTISGSGTRDVVLRFRPGQRFQAGLLVSGVGVAVCVWLLFRRGRIAVAPTDEAGTP